MIKLGAVMENSWDLLIVSCLKLGLVNCQDVVRGERNF